MDFKKPVYSWYALYTKVNREKKVQENLKEANIESYLPLSKTLRQWSDRKKWIEEPLFRCYIFVRVSNLEFFSVLKFDGVVKYVSFGGSPQTIPDNQIDNIRTLIKHKQEEVILTKDHVAKGVKAEVLYGPLKGVKGEVVEILGQSRILIRIESIGCSLHTNISRDEIRLLNGEEENNKKLKLNSKSKLVGNSI